MVYKELENKRNLRYCKEVINHTPKDQKYIFGIATIKDKINILKIRTNSHKLQSETRCWTIPKMSWHERIFNLCDNRKVENKKHVLLKCPMYSHIRSQFQNICNNINIPNPLTHQTMKI